VTTQHEKQVPTARAFANPYHFCRFTEIVLAYFSVMEMWESQGGQAYQVIEPVDGFHPSQTGQALTSSYLFNLLNANNPNLLGKVNPYNDKIEAQFADQGGY